MGIISKVKSLLNKNLHTNVVMVINPYKYKGQWVFDDDRVGLVKEPFVAGADTFLDMVTDNAESCKIVFSKHSVPGYNVALNKMKPEAGGTIYEVWDPIQFNGFELWLCPALLKYFKEPPLRLYAEITV